MNYMTSQMNCNLLLLLYKINKALKASYAAKPADGRCVGEAVCTLLLCSHYSYSLHVSEEHFQPPPH